MKVSVFFAVAALACSYSTLCYAGSNDKNGWTEDLKKLASDINLQSSSFHVEPAFGHVAAYSFDYTTQQIEDIERLTRHQDPEPVPLVRFGFKSSSGSSASKITQRMLHSLATDGTISFSYAW